MANIGTRVLERAIENGIVKRLISKFFMSMFHRGIKELAIKKPLWTKPIPFGYVDGQVSKIKEGDPYLTEMVIQEHNAKRAGKHYDIRIPDPKRKVAWSWATKKDIFKKKRVQLFRQPDHTINYMDFEGEITDGYGAGTVKTFWRGDVLVHPYKNDHLRIITDKQTFVFAKQGNNWYSNHAALASSYWIERNKYTLNVPSDLEKNPDYHISIKVDGGNYISVLKDKNVSFISRRLSVDGKPVHQEDKVPHLKYMEVPKQYEGIVVRGELWHPGPKNKFFGDSSFLAGLLNSNPIKAIKGQLKYGKIRFAPFDILKIPGKKVDKWTYEQKLLFLKRMERDINNRYWKLPPEYVKSRKFPTVLSWIQWVKAKGGEGVVVKNLKKIVDEDKWVKIKKKNELVLKIVDFVEGKNRLAGNGIGTFVVADATGDIIGEVGSGLTDEIRRDAYQNFRKYKGKKIEVKVMEITKNRRLRAPVFMGFTDSELSVVQPPNDEALYSYATAVTDSPEEIENVKYAMLVSRGWRPKK